METDWHEIKTEKENADRLIDDHVTSDDITLQGLRIDVLMRSQNRNDNHMMQGCCCTSRLMRNLTLCEDMPQ